MPLSREISSEINRILAALRAGLDASSYPVQVTQDHPSEIRAIYLRFEDIRFAYRARTNRGRGSPSADEDAVAELARSLAALLKDPMFSELSRAARFRPLNMTRPSIGFTLHPGLMQPRLSVHDATSHFVDGLATLPIQFDSIDSSLDGLGKLTDIVPREQNIAPVHFGISGHRLIIVPQPAITAPDDQSNVISARRELVDQAQRIIEQLQRSNCDKRLLDSVEYLKQGLQSEADVVRLGLSNIACDAMRQKFDDELPHAVSAMLFAQTTGVSLYVAQFSEWHRFTEKAAQSQISEADAPQVARALTEVLDRINSHPEIADEDVPRTLLWLRAFVDDPRRTSQRAVYAVWRSIENMVITVFNYGAKLLGNTASKTSDKLSSAASRAIVVALMTAALAGAATLSPIASKIPGSAWIAKAVDAVQESFKHI
jgi:hypothetical protein